MSTRKPIVWMGSSRKDLTAMPFAVKKDFGGALHGVQDGRTPESAKALRGKAQGAVQLAEDHDGEAYRTVYTVELEGVVYVLHCFQKKSKRGIATPKGDIEVIARRLKDARMLHDRRDRKKP